MARFISKDCVGCGSCVPFCPMGAISQAQTGYYQVDPETCVDCGNCQKMCPAEAIAPTNPQGNDIHHVYH